MGRSKYRSRIRGVIQTARMEDFTNKTKRSKTQYDVPYSEQESCHKPRTLQQA